MFASKAKINVFSSFFQGRQKGPEVKLKKKSLILVFEVIIQSPKHIFEIGIFFRILAHCVDV